MSATLTARTPYARRPTLAEPHGLTSWRAALGVGSGEHLSAAQALHVLSAARSGVPMGDVRRQTGLGRTQVLDVIAGVGSRIGQANKSGPRAARCVSAGTGRRLGVGTGVHTIGGKLTVIMGEGWSRTRQDPRDVSVSYAALLLADAAQDADAARRWVAGRCDPAELTYHHFSHLFAVAWGTFPTLDGISVNPIVQDSYVRAFDILADAIAQATKDVAVVLELTTAPAQVLEAVRGCFWLLGPFARPVAAAAHAAAATGQRSVALNAAVRQLRDAVTRRPLAFAPRSLADLAQSQMRAVLARLGYPVPEDEEAREGTGEALLAAALAARARAGLSDAAS